MSAPRYSHSDGKGSPELKVRFDAVCMAATPDYMRDWLSPRDYVGGPLVVAAKPTPTDPKAPKPPSEALSRAIGAKKP